MDRGTKLMLGWLMLTSCALGWAGGRATATSGITPEEALEQCPTMTCNPCPEPCLDYTDDVLYIEGQLNKLLEVCQQEPEKILICPTCPDCDCGGGVQDTMPSKFKQRFGFGGGYGEDIWQAGFDWQPTKRLVIGARYYEVHNIDVSDSVFSWDGQKYNGSVDTKDGVMMTATWWVK